MLKDTLIYALVVLAIVVGTFKVGQTLRALSAHIHRWLVLVIMAFGTIACGVPAIVLEFNFKDNILRAGKSLEYLMPWQQDLIAVHIVIRLCLLIALITFAFLRFFREIERINLEAQ